MANTVNPYAIGGLSAAQSIIAGYGQAQNYRLEADNLEWQAMQMEQYARQQAEKVAKQGRYAEGAAAVGVQQSGFAAGSGTTDLLMAELSKNIQSDIYQTALSGKLQAISARLQAGLNRTAAGNAIVQSVLGGAVQGFSGYSAASSYNKSLSDRDKAKADAGKSVLGG